MIYKNSQTNNDVAWQDRAIEHHTVYHTRARTPSHDLFAFLALRVLVVVAKSVVRTRSTTLPVGARAAVLELFSEVNNGPCQSFVHRNLWFPPEFHLHSNGIRATDETCEC